MTLTLEREGLSQYRMNKRYQFRNDCSCQMRNDDSLEQDGSYRSDKNWPDSGSVLKENQVDLCVAFGYVRLKVELKITPKFEV